VQPRPSAYPGFEPGCVCVWRLSVRTHLAAARVGRASPIARGLDATLEASHPPSCVTACRCGCRWCTNGSDAVEHSAVAPGAACGPLTAGRHGPNRMPSSTTDASSPCTYRRLRELSRWCQGHISIRRRACHARAGLPVLCPGAPSDSKAINPVFVVRPAACSVWAAASLVTHAQGSKLYSVSVAGHSRRRRAQPATSGDGKVGGSLRRCSNRKPAAGMRRH